MPQTILPPESGLVGLLTAEMDPSHTESGHSVRRTLREELPESKLKPLQDKNDKLLEERRKHVKVNCELQLRKELEAYFPMYILENESSNNSAVAGRTLNLNLFSEEILLRIVQKSMVIHSRVHPGIILVILPGASL